MNSVNNTIISIIVLLCLGCIFWVGFQIGRKHPILCDSGDSSVVVDTLIVHDTITKEKPLYLTRTVIDSVPFPVPVHVMDTIWRTDTIWMEREQVQWEDSLCRVYASGISPQVDSVTHFIRKEVVTEIRTISVPSRKRWGIGVQVGYGGCIQNGQVFTSPYVGVGVSYNLFSW